MSAAASGPHDFHLTVRNVRSEGRKRERAEEFIRCMKLPRTSPAALLGPSSSFSDGNRVLRRRRRSSLGGARQREKAVPRRQRQVRYGITNAVSKNVFRFDLGIAAGISFLVQGNRYIFCRVQILLSFAADGRRDEPRRGRPTIRFRRRATETPAEF